jgi:outer membrane protein
MRNVAKAALVMMCLMVAVNTTRAQSKISYVNFGQLVQQMPEAKQLQDQIKAYSKQFIDELTSMNNDYQAKLKAYTDQRTTMTDAMRTVKEQELTQEQKRLQEYSNTSQQQVEAKSNDLAKPLYDKVRAAVAQAAKEKGYDYVIDTTQADVLLVAPPGDDLMAAAKAKLGIK